MTSNFIPQQIHLALAGISTLAISWMSLYNITNITNLNNISNSIVKYGLEPNCI